MVRARRNDWKDRGSPIPHITVAFQVCKALKDSPEEIWLTPGGIGLHGIFGKNIPDSEYFHREKWNPNIEEDLKYALMECWKIFVEDPNIDPGKSSLDREHQTVFWKRNYKVHSTEVKMTQEEYLAFGVQQFKRLKEKVNHALFENSFGPSYKAVALRVSGDRAAFYGCRILSYQDSLLDDAGRHYYNGCYIEGGTDFICGNGASLFEKCHLHTLSQGTSAITAQRRASPTENTGFTFLGCSITGEGTAVLGRPWGAYSRVVFAINYMSNVILSLGCDDWGDPTKQRYT